MSTKFFLKYPKKFNSGVYLISREDPFLQGGDESGNTFGDLSLHENCLNLVQ
jgi:hypothetical protein